MINSYQFHLALQYSKVRCVLGSVRARASNEPLRVGILRQALPTIMISGPWLWDMPQFQPLLFLPCHHAPTKRPAGEPQSGAPNVAEPCSGVLLDPKLKELQAGLPAGGEAPQLARLGRIFPPAVGGKGGSRGMR